MKHANRNCACDMLALFKNHYMLDIPELQPGQASGEGLEESKTGDYSDSDDVDPSTFVKVVANTFATSAEVALIRSGSVTAEQLRTGRIFCGSSLCSWTPDVPTE